MMSELGLYLLTLLPTVWVLYLVGRRAYQKRLVNSPDSPPPLETPVAFTLIFFLLFGTLLVEKSPLFFYVAVGGIAFLLTSNRYPIEQQFGLGKITWRRWLTSVAAVGVTSIALLTTVSFLVEFIIEFFWHHGVMEQSAVQDFRHLSGRRQLVIFLVQAVVVAPAIEEICFRGLLFSFLKKYVPVRSALVLSSFLFALAHRDAGAFLPLWALGFILALLYETTGVLSLSIGVHAFFNLVNALELLADKYNLWS